MMVQGVPLLTARLRVAGPESPARIQVPDGATLSFCPGRWHARITVLGGTAQVHGRATADRTVLDGAGGGPILDATAASVLGVARLTFEGGRALRGGAILGEELRLSVSDCAFVDNQATGDGAAGGAVYVHDGSMEVHDTMLRGNRVDDPLGSGNGGAIRLHDGDVDLFGVVATDNHADGRGGVLAAYDGGLLVRHGSFRDNHAGEDGGALYLYQGTVELDGTHLGRNVSRRRGGALSVYDGDVKLNETTMIGNEVVGADGDGGGGAIGLYQGLVEVVGSELRSNTARDEGGAVFVYQGRVDLNTSSLRDNVAAEGGAIWGYRLRVDADRCTFVDNHAIGATERTIDGDGGAIEGASVSRVIATDSVFTDNTASDDGGAINVAGPVSGTSVIEVDGCTFRRNTAGHLGGAVRGYDGDVVSTATNWGTGADDNSPEDVLAHRTTRGWYGPAASFRCSADACR